MSASMTVDIRYVGFARNGRSAHIDCVVDENDPLELLMAMEDRDDAEWDQINAYPSRSALVADWLGRVYYDHEGG